MGSVLRAHRGDSETVRHQTALLHVAMTTQVAIRTPKLGYGPGEQNALSLKTLRDSTPEWTLFVASQPPYYPGRLCAVQPRCLWLVKAKDSQTDKCRQMDMDGVRVGRDKSTLYPPGLSIVPV